jgi:hypothetical protein
MRRAGVDSADALTMIRQCGIGVRHESMEMLFHGGSIAAPGP